VDKAKNESGVWCAASWSLAASALNFSHAWGLRTLNRPDGRDVPPGILVLIFGRRLGIMTAGCFDRKT